MKKKLLFLSIFLLITAADTQAQGWSWGSWYQWWQQQQNNNGGNNNGGNSGGGNQGIGGGSSSAEEAAAANQSANLALSNAIEITFEDNLSFVGSDVTLAFADVNDYANGVESAEQALKIRSNKNFSIAVKTNAASFTYSGNTTPAPAMPVSGILALKVTENNTGGSIGNGFSTSSYATLSNNNQTLIASGSRGGNQTFGVKYKATPGFAYPAGTYSVDVVYTATQQ